MLDRRYKHRLHEKQPFYLFIRNKLNHIFYVRYTDGRQISTGCTDINEAYNFAVKNLSAEKPKKNTFHKILLEYYELGSKWQKYDSMHSAPLTERERVKSCSRMKVISEKLPDVREIPELTRSRLIRLQDDLKNLGLSAKTVNGYMTVLHRAVRQLVDRELMRSDPFIGLKQMKGEKAQRICFPVGIVRGKFNDSKLSLMAYVAIATGARRGEFFKWDIEKGILRIHGTKSIYSDRSVPISDETERKIRLLETMGIRTKDFEKCVAYMKQVLGYDREGIVFHSFRKMFKTILTSANLNTTLIETMMGHSNNQQSNNVERIYFVEEAAELSEVYDLVRETMKKYLE